jgi:hypothetical protein
MLDRRMNMWQVPEEGRRLVFSYLTLRKVIGLLGTLLPFVLAVGGRTLFGLEIQGSISAYYHTPMGDVLVGMLFAIGFFLLSYRGYEPVDDFAGTVAWIAACGVALCPVYSSVGYLHHIFAFLFFVSLIYFALVLFTKTDPDGTPTKRKLQRNLVYRVCGVLMSLCVALIPLQALLPSALRSRVRAYDPVFWLESLAIVAFGVSWMVKGGALLQDEADHAGIPLDHSSL